jgi:hypothetical protein
MSLPAPHHPPQLAAARDAASREVSWLQAEAAAQGQRLQEVCADRDALRRSLAAAEDALRASQHDAQALRSAGDDLRRARDDLDRSNADLEQRLQAAVEDQRRMGVVMQGMEAAKQGLQRRLTCYEGAGSAAGSGMVTPTGSPAPRPSPLGGGAATHSSPARDPWLAPRSVSPAGSGGAGASGLWRRSGAASLAAAGVSFSPGTAGGGGGSLTDTILAANLTNIQVRLAQARCRQAA